MSVGILQLNVEMAKQTIALLTGFPDTPMTWQLWDDKKLNRSGISLEGSIADVWPQICEKQQEGFAVGLSVYQTDGKGRKASNMVRPYAASVDLDYPFDASNLPYALRVASKRGPQLAWLLASSESLEQAEELIAWLTCVLAGDTQYSKKTPMVRCPGTYHLKGDPYLVMGYAGSQATPQRCVDIKDAVLKAMGITALQRLENYQVTRKNNRNESDRYEIPNAPEEVRFESAKKYVEKMPPAIQGEHGHTALFNVAQVCVNRFGLSDSAAFDLLMHYNARCVPPWEGSELVREFNHKIRQARENGRMPKGRRLRVVKPDENYDEAAAAKLPRIEMNWDLERCVDAAEVALSTDMRTFAYGNVLSRIIAGKVSDLAKATLRERMTSTAEYYGWDGRKGDYVRKLPTPEILDALYCRGEWPNVRNLDGISVTPLLRSDGSIFNEGGYDSQTSMVMNCAPIDDLPDNPTLEDKVNSQELLKYILKDFPFQNESHRATWVAMVLSYLMRSAYDGPAPFFHIDANRQGSGKGLLARIYSLIVDDREPGVQAFDSKEAEIRKTITALALAGARSVFVDNWPANKQLGGPSLEAAMTTTRWVDRELGASRRIDVPLKAIWIGTGNNIRFSKDFTRRVAYIRLVSMLDNPQDRTDLTEIDLASWVKNNRQRLLRAFFVLIRAWYVAGKPRAKILPWGSFEAWSDTVRQVVIYSGFSDPKEAAIELVANETDDDEEARILITGLSSIIGIEQGMTAREILNVLRKESGAWRDLCDMLQQMWILKDDTTNVVEFGHLLGRYRDVVVDGKQLIRKPQAVSNKKPTKWVILKSR